MPIFLAAAASSGASPAPSLDWLDTISADYPIGPLTYLSGFEVTLGTLFTTTTGGLCTGIKMRLGTVGGAAPNYIALSLWNVPPASVFVPLSTEQIAYVPSMSGDIVQTTGAFTAVNLLPNTQYIVSAYINGSFGPYNYAADVSGNPGYLPKNFPKYTVEIGSQSFAGAVANRYPNVNNPQYANYIEPLIA